MKWNQTNDPGCASTTAPPSRRRPVAGLILLASLLAAAPAACRRKPSEGSGAQPAARRPTTTQLTLLTYNVLSDPRRAAERAPALLQILREVDADIVALQEAAPWFVKLLRDQPWFRSRYRTTSIGAANVAPGGLLILSRFPITRSLVARLPGRQGRVVLMADLRIDGTTVAVGTVHLESFLQDGARRAEQLKLVFPLLQHGADAILMGDFNFEEGAVPETAHLDKAYKDLWTALRRNAPGYTWDNERSPMAKRNAFPGEPSRRLDRILFRSETWRPHTVRIIGFRPVSQAEPVLFPSDHFGVLGVLQHRSES
ncbi:MAG: endonuclease/exonuclease/phosphatase family protein [bacterium]